MDLFQSMKVFATVVEMGSFTKAADALHSTRPSVTNAVQILEAHLGTRLLHRTTRKISLTTEGDLYYQKVRKILEEVADAKALVSTNASVKKPSGKLRIDIPVALARPLIIPRLAAFKQKYPDIDLVVGVSDRPIDLIADGIDCVVRLGDLPNSTMIGRRIGHVSMVTCASPDYIKKFGRPMSVADVHQHKAVGFFSGKNRKVMDWHFVVNGKSQTIKFKPGILVNDSEAFIESGLAGFGLMQAIGIGVSRYLESGQLKEVLSDMQPPSRMVSVMYPNKRYLPPQVRVFVDWISDLFANSDNRWVSGP
ncbi:MAG TPA: LysR substrate-binding domain-containing protein [Oxalicibacterium sp.]